MVTKAALTGMGTGIALLAAMYYPLYVVLPGFYVAEWQTSSATLGIAMSFLGALLLLVAGFVTARVARTTFRKQGALLGAMAGAIAALILYFGLGSAAAGVIGSGDLLTHGPRPASGEAHLMVLLTESVTRAVVRTNQAFWGLLLGGSALAAVGGALSRPRVSEKPLSGAALDSRLGCILAMAALLASGASLMVTVVILGLLPGSVARAAEKANYSPSISPESVLNWPAGTGMAFLLAATLCVLLAVRAESTGTSIGRQRSAQIAAYIAAVFLVVVLGVLFPLVDRPFVANPIFIVGAALNLIMVVGMLRIAAAVRRRLREATTEVQSDERASGFLQREYWRSHFVELSLGVGAALFLPAFAGTVPSCLSLMLVPVRMITILVLYGPTADPQPVADFTSSSVADSLFVVHAQITASAFVIIAVLVALAIKVSLMIGWIVRRLRGRATVTG
jgi:hypothetical protein